MKRDVGLVVAALIGVVALGAVVVTTRRPPSTAPERTVSIVPSSRIEMSAPIAIPSASAVAPVATADATPPQTKPTTSTPAPTAKLRSKPVDGSGWGNKKEL